MLFDHLTGIKNPFGKLSYGRPVLTVYLTLFIVVILSLLFTIQHVFTFIIQNFEMVPMKSTLMIRIFSFFGILFQFLIPTIFMFVYIFMISFHIHESQKASYLIDTSKLVYFRYSAIGTKFLILPLVLPVLMDCEFIGDGNYWIWSIFYFYVNLGIRINRIKKLK